jgi:hypothetical protein
VVNELLERCDKSMFVTLMPEMVHAGRSKRGGWSKEQLDLLGVEWPPTKGWIGRLTGKRVTGSALAAFLRLKDAHLPPECAGLFDDVEEADG